jgi:phosphohistidine phosphatase
MKRLTLLRHAKATKESSYRDFDRPLTRQGREDAARIGALMAAQAIAPDLALCSPAARTRATLERAASQLKSPPESLFSERLYDAFPADILAEIRAAPETASHLLVVGHNPGLHALALALVDRERSRTEMVGELADNFPPGALAQFAFRDKTWALIDLGGGALSFYASPAALRD